MLAGYRGLRDLLAGNQVVDSTGVQIGYVFDYFNVGQAVVCSVLISEGSFDSVFNFDQFEDFLCDQIKLIGKAKVSELYKKVEELYGRTALRYREKALLNFALTRQLPDLRSYIRKGVGITLLKVREAGFLKVASDLKRDEIPGMSIRRIKRGQGYVGVVAGLIILTSTTKVQFGAGVAHNVQSHSVRFDFKCGTEQIKVTADLPLNLRPNEPIQVIGVLRYPSLTASAVYAPNMGMYWVAR